MNNNFNNVLNQLKAIDNAIDFLSPARLENALLNISCDYDYLSISDFTIDNFLQGALAYVDNKKALTWAINTLISEIDAKRLAVESEQF